MAFYVGQKVECVDDKPPSCNAVIFPYKKGDICIVSNYYFDIPHQVWALSVNGLWHSWSTRRFRPLVSRPTSISIFTAMLSPKVKEPI